MAYARDLKKVRCARCARSKEDIAVSIHLGEADGELEG